MIDMDNKKGEKRQPTQPGHLGRKVLRLDAKHEEYRTLQKRANGLEQALNRLMSAKAFHFWQLTAVKQLAEPAEGVSTKPPLKITQQEEEWFQDYIATEEPPRREKAGDGSNLENQPTISIVTPVYNTDHRFLRACLQSVKDQTYPHWQHILVDDSSPDPKVRQILDEHAATDDRVVVIKRTQNGGISAATNDGIEAATGQYIAFLDNDDLLEADALYWVAATINEHPTTEFFYSDRDLFEGDLSVRFSPFFKPDKIPELMMLSANVLTHFNVLSKDLADRIGPLDRETDGAQDWDYYLRAMREMKTAMVHIPYILYHWRVSPTSTSQSISTKPYARLAQALAITRHCRAKGYPCEAVLNEENEVELQYTLPHPPSVTIHTILHDDSYQSLLHLGHLCETVPKSWPELRVVIHGDNAEQMLKQVETRGLQITTAPTASDLSFLQQETADYSIVIADWFVPDQEDWVIQLIGPHLLGQQIWATTGKAVVRYADRRTSTVPTFAIADNGENPRLTPLFAGFPKHHFGPHGCNNWFWEGDAVRSDLFCVPHTAYASLAQETVPASSTAQWIRSSDKKTVAFVGSVQFRAAERTDQSILNE